MSYFQVNPEAINSYEEMREQRQAAIEELVAHGVPRLDAYEIVYGIYMLGFNRAQKVYST